MIEKTSFGSMTIDGRTYTSDLIIFPDGHVEDQWRRASGHKLAVSDIEDLITREPSVLIVGMGVYGRMKPDSELKNLLADRDIEVLAARTKTAAGQYNAVSQKRAGVAACFHLTC